MLQMNNMVCSTASLSHIMCTEEGRIFGIVTGMYWEFGCIISYTENLLQSMVTGNKLEHSSYIDDSLEPLWNSAENAKAAGEIINLGGIEEIEIREAARVLSDITGGVEINYLEARHEVKHAWSTWEKSADILDFQYKTSLEEGVRQMWNGQKINPSVSALDGINMNWIEGYTLTGKK